MEKGHRFIDLKDSRKMYMREFDGKKGEKKDVIRF